MSNASMTQHASRWTTPLGKTGGQAAAFALLAVAVSPANASNSVVIDFEQGRLILGWIGLWAVAALTFVLCTARRLDLLPRLSRHLAERAQRNAQRHADRALLKVAQDDPRAMADIRAAALHNASSLAQDLPVGGAAAVTDNDAATALQTAPAHRGFKTTPMPGMPGHVQYLPG